MSTAFFSLTVDVRYSWSSSSRKRRSSTINSSIAGKKGERRKGLIRLRVCRCHPECALLPMSLVQSDHQMKHSSMRRELAKPGPLHTHDPPSHTLMAPSPSLRGSKAQLEKSQSQSQQKEQPQSRHYSMSVPDAEFQCTERDQTSKCQFSSSHQHTGYNM